MNLCVWMGSAVRNEGDQVCSNQSFTSSLLRHYELKRNEDIVSFFNDFSDHLAEEALWELSLKIKPRNITRRKTEREEKT